MTNEAESAGGPSTDDESTKGAGAAQGRLIDPENRRARSEAPGTPVITVHDPTVVKLFDATKPGLTGAEMSLRLQAPVDRPVRLRNVIGLLRGSDPVLRDSYVLLSAHYDHLGTRPELAGDNIFNGANDDGSGTVSVIELASAFATLRQRPRRSIVFMTFFGEEKGLLGSRYYGRHPVFPIDKTVAEYWKQHYDLRNILETNWATLGPKVADKLNVYVGDADSYFLNMGVHLLDDFLKTAAAPKWDGEIVFQPMAPHCWGPSLRELIPKMTAHMERHAPAGADLRSWRY